MIYDIYFAPSEYEFNLYYSLGKFSKQNDIFLIFSQKIGFDISCKLSPFGDSLHDMSKPIFIENIKKIIQNVVC